MGTAIFMVLMVSGYWYTSRDLNSRFKIRRSSGWDVYFLVALYGCIFVLQGVFATGLVWLLLLCVSGIANAVQMIPGVHLKWQVEFMNWSFLGIQAPVVVMLAFAILLCLYRSNWAGSARLNVSGRKDLYQRLSRSNGVEQLLFQCMEEGELAWITLKSRRIYIGMVHASTFEYESTKNIVLIPMLSGYRDSKTLKLAVEHNYSKWYAEHNITLDSSRKDAMSFRKVIMVDQIESLSLFDPASATALSMGHPQEVEKSQGTEDGDRPDAESRDTPD